MATSAKAFFAGIGATFVILAIGFGGGVMLARSALKEPSGFPTHAAGEALMAFGGDSSPRFGGGLFGN